MSHPLLWTFDAFHGFDHIMFIAAPYVVLVLFLSMTLLRYLRDRFSYSTRSTQFLENGFHFWGSVPWHIGILALLVGHLLAFLVPDRVLGWNAVPARLYITEVAGLVFGVLALTGLINIIVRIYTNTKVRAATKPMDKFIMFLLLYQVITGLWVALTAQWGSNWFAAVLAPYLGSIFTFSPEIAAVVDMPLIVKLHIIGAWAIFAVFPFTRLVHVLVIPNPYLWRKPQVVIWNRHRAGGR